MLRVVPESLPPETQEHLDQKQASIDEKIEYKERVEEAKTQWDKKSSKHFGTIKGVLTKSCSPTIRCHYCEDSQADEIEHIWPKSLYPERAFSWQNYLFACGPCNGTYKKDHFAVFDQHEEVVDVTRPPKAPIITPTAGEAVLIDQRQEDPLSFMTLDFATGMFVGARPPGSHEDKRAYYTIDLLGLNRRDSLIAARRAAYRSYQSLMKDYITTKEQAGDLEPLAQAIRGQPHQTVWEEMKRNKDFYPALNQIFSAAPELLSL